MFFFWDKEIKSMIESKQAAYSAHQYVLGIVKYITQSLKYSFGLHEESVFDVSFTVTGIFSWE